MGFEVYFWKQALKIPFVNHLQKANRRNQHVTSIFWSETGQALESET